MIRQRSDTYLYLFIAAVLLLNYCVN